MSNVTEVFKSIQETGGASYNIATGVLNPNTGWMVSTSGNEKKIKPPTDIVSFMNEVNQYLRSLSPNGTLRIDILTNESLYLGFWIHEGELYMDISEWYEWFTEAVQVGVTNNQLAIWDCSKGEDFPLTMGSIEEKIFECKVKSFLNS